MVSITTSLAVLASIAASVNGAFTKDSFKEGVYFGDSYTDTGRGMGTKAPGWEEPAGGGFIKNWPIEATTLSGSKRHNYAQSGSSCSSAILGGFLPGIKENQIPAFQADKKFTKGGKPFLDLPPKDTIYAIWIGTNDLGAQGLLPQAAGASKVPAYTECVFNAFDSLYAAGGRKFILMNVIPLNLLPMYTVMKGKGADGLYPNKPATAEGLKTANKKLEGMVLESNTLFNNKSQAAFKGAKPRYPGAEMAIYDVHKFVTDIYNDPKSCLKGAGANNDKWGFSDSNMWGDALHPSPALGKCVATEFVNVAHGSSKYATYLADGAK
ncbi:hypothetical protein BT63DRAFT_442602 [Microthyrium microscopicum]|uniref:GDSL lipase/acylhydrolase family protein n=1 Tax=Microthyrium microscopicum TaxID=703497 RepID=A0A6A6U235_9PEZI|nr:hypothetical protein BT63DRAFT_442602 [Microthyrium microscopicum]